MKKERIKIRDYLQNIPETYFASGLFMAALLLILGLTIFFHYKSDFLGHIMGALYHSLLDIVIFGILIVMFNKIAEKRRDIKRWKEEIEDFRGWHETGAKYRIVGNIKRLNRSGVTKIDLNHCYLKHAYLFKCQLEEAILKDADLEGANICNSNLRSAKLNRANLRNAQLRSTNLQMARLNGINFQGADLTGANLEEAIISESTGDTSFIRPNLRETRLLGTIFKGANLAGADLRGAIVAAVYKPLSIKAANKIYISSVTNFQEANLDKADLRGLRIVESSMYEKSKYSERPGSPKEVEILVGLFSNAKFLGGAQLDHELEIQMKEKYPHLFKKP